MAVLFSGSLLTGCTLKKTPAALQITSKPTANVFLNGKLLGKTPYQSGNLSPGELSIKLIPESDILPLVSWEGKIKLVSGIETLIEREFATSEASSSGQILSLERIKNKKEASLSVISEPDGALVKLDGEGKGFSPLLLEKVSEGDHELSISKEGFAEKVINAKAVNGFKLLVNVKLAHGGGGGDLAVTPTPASQPSGSTGIPAKPYIEVKETPTGWLRVRLGPSTTATEAAKVKPGEKYPLLEEKSGWYKIRYDEDKEGWVSGTYATKVE